MGRGLALTVRSLAALEEERHLRARSEAQSRENVRLVRQLQERQTLLERLAKIGQSISHRAPFAEVLDAIVRGASELVNAEIASFRLRDEANADALVILAQVGLAPEVLAEMALEPAARGASSRSVTEDQPVVIADYPRFEGGIAALIRDGVQVAMAAPVRETGRVVGSLTVASREAGRVFTPAEQDTLVAFAEHASLALTDSKMAAAMQHQVLHDALTGLPNRTLFQERLSQALLHAQRHEGVVAVLYLDLDRFKSVNDGYGHLAGDNALKEIAHRVEAQIRSMDTAARFGGDELAVLMPEATAAEAVTLAERIREVIGAVPFALTAHVERSMTVSVGVAAVAPGRHETDMKAVADRLLADADAALYRAKALGRNRVQVGAG